MKSSKVSEFPVNGISIPEKKKKNKNKKTKQNKKQTLNKYDLKSLWYNANWDWTQVSWTIGEHSTLRDNEPFYIYIYKAKKNSSKL